MADAGCSQFINEQHRAAKLLWLRAVWPGFVNDIYAPPGRFLSNDRQGRSPRSSVPVDYVDPKVVISISALCAGMFLALGGLYALRRGKYGARQGATILASLAVAVGTAVAALGALLLVLNV